MASVARILYMSESKKVAVRVIAATNADILTKINAGPFRLDLYHRLSGMLIEISPLRERKSDILLLATHFLSQKSHLNDAKQIRGFQEVAMTLLMRYSCPGNIRELENRIEQARVLARSDWISITNLRIDVAGKLDTENKGLTGWVDEYERILIIDALEGTVDQQTAADHLGIPEPTLRYKMDKYGIKRRRST